ncbi:MAG: simple sugar transport system substrate-binding protein [Pseudonocardiales bacterium]|jgi:simple sugar transport system substrate-binding protein|nr:simple sugar transport system substrate-binding protein [Pseudonocardiales bacterium]
MIRRVPPVWLAAVLAGVLLLSACSSANSVNVQHNKAGGGSGGYKYDIAVVTHGGTGDSFWSIVKAGAVQAGKDMGDKLTYESNGDPNTQSQQIDAAINRKPDGIVVSMANPAGVKAAVQRAVAAGIPVITINAGQAESKSFGALTHIGSDEGVAGQAVGTELKKDGAKNVICVVQEAGNVSLEQRCAGVKATLGGTITNLQVDNNNLPGAQQIISAKLQQDKSIDGVVTLGAQVATVAEKAIASAGSKAKLATFDLNADVAKAVVDGKILFAVDQQPYLQGYLAVVMLTQYKSNLNVLGGGQPVLTGPNLITKENAAAVLKLSAGGTR